ncbi:MAG: hypothetical protein H7Y20_15845 [Bryobacteraceae bacterium]|nr:hypothetical protein [Bryobacteraceae bacterium]
MSYIVSYIRVLFLLTLPVLVFAGEGVGARYIGGTVSTIPSGAGGKIQTTDELFFEFRSSGRQMNVSYDQINLLEYGQKVNRRIILAVALSPLFLLSKSRNHFLTVGYTDKDGKQQAMVFKIDSGKIRTVLVSLEARTGQKVQYQDDEARKAGKG